MTGMAIRASNGSVLVDMTMSFAQTFSYVETGAVNGSISIPPAPPGKTLFYIVVSLVNTQRELGKIPGVTISGSTLSWLYSYNTNAWGNFSANARIYYGYY